MKTKKESLLEEAYRRYTIGTKFKQLNEGPGYGDQTGRIREIQPYYKGEDVTFIIGNDNDVYCNSGLLPEDINGEPVCSNPRLRINGVWAEIVPDVNQFENYEIY